MMVRAIQNERLWGSTQCLCDIASPQVAIEAQPFRWSPPALGGRWSLAATTCCQRSESRLSFLDEKSQLLSIHPKRSG